MSPFLISALLFSQVAAASAPSASSPDQVFLDDKVGQVHLLDDEMRGENSKGEKEVYVADGPKRIRGKNAPKRRGRRGGSGFNFGAFGVGASGVSPQGRVFGIGLQLGFPTSVTIKYMLTGDQGIVAGLGFGTGWIAQALSLHVDYLYHPHVIARGPPLILSWYFGGGLWLGIADRNTASFIPAINYGFYTPTPINLWLGIRAPIGVQLAFRELPIEIYAEGVPALVFFPGITFALGATIGARFYF
ncbi:MAG: hypothetical protein GY822_00685 [Deltaproteobacteria bacterium]|nr:hypothetical protein [Deltaproteobacteria bacterium]